MYRVEWRGPEVFLGNGVPCDVTIVAIVYFRPDRSRAQGGDRVKEAIASIVFESFCVFFIKRLARCVFCLRSDSGIYCLDLEHSHFPSSATFFFY